MRRKFAYWINNWFLISSPQNEEETQADIAIYLFSLIYGLHHMVKKRSYLNNNNNTQKNFLQKIWQAQKH